MKASSSKSDDKRQREQVQQYFASLPPDTRRRLKELRDVIRATAPSAVDAFSYGIPAFRLDGRLLVWYAGWKQHVSIYPMTAVIRRGLARELEGYEVAKGTIRFPLSERLPSRLIGRLVKARMTQLRSASKAKARS
ncbi:MAG: iron chaperone [Gemmatimonadaceae bacterium]